jgi:predicted phage terminase large subunit-like protein
MASFEARGSEMFKEEWVIIDKEEPEGGEYYIAIDLAGFEEIGKARTKNKKLDNTAIAITKVGEYGWWVKDIIHGRWTLNDTAVKIFQAVNDYKPISVGIERGIARQAVISPLTDLMRQYNSYFRIEELTHGNKSKTDRVMWALQGRFENGVIKLNKGSWSETFLDELFQFPDILTHDDTIDALAYIDQLQTVTYREDFEVDEHELLDSVAGY